MAKQVSLTPAAGITVKLEFPTPLAREVFARKVAKSGSNEPLSRGFIGKSLGGSKAATADTRVITLSDTLVDSYDGLLLVGRLASDVGKTIRASLSKSLAAARDVNAMLGMQRAGSIEISGDEVTIALVDRSAVKCATMGVWKALVAEVDAVGRVLSVALLDRRMNAAGEFVGKSAKTAPFVLVKSAGSKARFIGEFAKPTKVAKPREQTANERQNAAQAEWDARHSFSGRRLVSKREMQRAMREADTYSANAGAL